MPGAEERYRKAYARTKMPIHVDLGGWTRFEDRVPGHMYLYVPQALDSEEIGDDDLSEAHEELGIRPWEDTIDPSLIQKARDKSLRYRKPGDPNRITPFLPFNLLHRMGDGIQEALGWQQTRKEDQRTGLLIRQVKFNMDRLNQSTPKYLPGEPRPVSRLSAFVDTQAGRIGALNDPSQAISDLFALYVKTGRIGWQSQEATNDRERTISRQIESKLPVVLERMVKMALHRPGH